MASAIRPSLNDLVRFLDERAGAGPSPFKSIARDLAARDLLPAINGPASAHQIHAALLLLTRLSLQAGAADVPAALAAVEMCGLGRAYYRQVVHGEANGQPATITTAHESPDWLAHFDTAPEFATPLGALRAIFYALREGAEVDKALVRISHAVETPPFGPAFSFELRSLRAKHEETITLMYLTGKPPSVPTRPEASPGALRSIDGALIEEVAAFLGPMSAAEIALVGAYSEAVADGDNAGAALAGAHWWQAAFEGTV